MWNNEFVTNSHKEDYNSVDLLLLSDKYNIVGLRRKCESYISKNLNLSKFHLWFRHDISLVQRSVSYQKVKKTKYLLKYIS